MSIDENKFFSVTDSSDLSQTVDIGRTLRIEDSAEAPQKRAVTKAFLNVIRSRADLGVHAFIDGPVFLGRDPKCTIPLHDFGVSRKHAVVMPDGAGNFILRDLGSTNGTQVNGVSISDNRILKDGEKIFVGDTVLRFSLADEMDIDFHSEVATLVSIDPLTGLPSKRRFDQALEFAIEDAKNAGKPLALLMMDMDGVKKINDTHGHLFGAHVIGETGRVIARVLGAKGPACRFGGDEFSAFLSEHDLDAACDVGEQIRSAVETAGLEKDGIPLKPTISIGVACYPDAGDDLLGLVAMADKALYRAKERGKNRVAR
jgi:diguanylate cyclase (GGDEF)-like protein